MAAEDGQLSPTELAAWRGFLRAHARIVRELDAELQARAGLPLRAYEVLLQLEDAPAQRLRMSELAERLLLSAGGATRLVDRLQQDGLVYRSTDGGDRR